MFITDLSIRRPVVSAVFSLILVLFGLFVFWKLPVRELPSGLQPPVVQVQVDYKSAAAPIVDQEITQIIEDVVGGAEGIRSIDSTSENGRSTIRIEFETDIDLEKADGWCSAYTPVPGGVGPMTINTLLMQIGDIRYTIIEGKASQNSCVTHVCKGQ